MNETFMTSLPSHLAESSRVTAGEMQLAAGWLDATLAAAAGAPDAWIDGWLAAGLPFRWRYHGEDAAATLAHTTFSAGAAEAGAGEERRTLAWSDPAGGLRVTWEIRRFTDFPAVEWLLSFENTGLADLPPLEDVQALGLHLQHGCPGRPAFVHGAYGGGCRANDMWPFVRTAGDPGNGPVVLGSPTIASLDGLPSSDYLPFFNVELPEGRGVVGGLGLAGEWQATIDGQGTGVEVCAGFRPRTFTLGPGERMRTHRILLLFWQGKPLHGNNMLRRLLYKHYVPPLDGEPRQPLVTANVAFAYHGVGGFLEQATEGKVLPLVEPYARMGVEQVTIDAGWYPTGSGNWVDGLGSWDLAPEKYPHGLRPVAGAVKAAGMRLGVWFAPELISGDKPVRQAHPDWVAPWDKWSDGMRMELPEVREWFLAKVDQLIEQGAELYRQDGGLRRNHLDHDLGLLAVWDEIWRRHPGLLMEGCCGGGRNIDLETLMRFHWHQKSDRWGFTEEDQGGLYGANLYLPGGAISIFTYRPDAYTLWSSFAGQLSLACPDPLAPDFPFEEVARQVALYKQVRPLLSGDFYPLTPCTFEAWLGYQFHRPDLDAGLALLFRRPAAAGLLSESSCYTAYLRGLDPDARYRVTVRYSDAPDSLHERAAGGCDLAEQGLTIEIGAPRGAALITYERS